MRNIKVESKTIRYRCLRCGGVFTAYRVFSENRRNIYQCPECGFTVLEKVRRDMGNRLLAR